MLLLLSLLRHTLRLILLFRAQLMLKDERRKIDQLELPRRKCVIQFILEQPPEETVHYWLLSKPGEETDLCFTDPKHEVDLFVVCDLRALTAAWMGHSTFEAEIDADRICLSGDELMARTLTRWLVRSSYADVLNHPACEETRRSSG